MSSKIQNINRKLIISQINVHTSKDLIMTSCLRDFVIKKLDILAIQKFWRNIHTKIIHHSLKNTFQLIFSNSKKINENVVRICFFVNKRIFIVDLNDSLRSENLVTLQIKLIEDFNDEHYIQIHNLYNESNIRSCTFLTELQMFLKKKQIQQRRFRFIHAIYHSRRLQFSSFDLKRRLSQSRFESIKIISNNERISVHFEFEVRNFYFSSAAEKTKSS